MVYDDGTLVWSKDPISGGSPLYRTTVTKSGIETFLRGVRNKAYFKNRALNEPHYGPDAAYSVIYVKDEDKTLCLRSWHEIYEKEPKCCRHIWRYWISW